MSNMEKEPTSEPELRQAKEGMQEEKEIVETEKGEVFENYKDFYSAYEEAGISSVFRIHGKRVENGELMDDSSGFIDARPHKITEHSANMNVYEGGELIAYFRLNQDNISQFRIEII